MEQLKTHLAYFKTVSFVQRFSDPNRFSSDELEEFSILKEDIHTRVDIILLNLSLLTQALIQKLSDILARNITMLQTTVDIDNVSTISSRLDLFIKQYKLKSVLWEVANLEEGSDAATALAHYSRIGRNLENNPVISELKGRLQNLSVIDGHLKTFMAYVMPSYCGKTQSVFAMGQNLLPLFFPIGLSGARNQSIYSAFDSSYRSLRMAFDADFKVVNTVPSGKNFNTSRAGHKFFVLGLLNEMMAVGRTYLALVGPRPSWMEYFLLSREESVPIAPMSLVEFRAKYPADRIVENGVISTLLTPFAVVLDEFPSDPVDDLEGINQADISYSINLATFLRNLGRAAGFAVMVMGTNSHTYNLVATRSASESRSDDVRIPEKNYWCSVFVQGTGAPVIQNLVEDSGCAELFWNTADLETFKYAELVSVWMKSPIRFIFRQVRSSRPGIGYNLLRILSTTLLSSAEKLAEYRNNVKLFWSDFTREFMLFLYTDKRLRREAAIRANHYLMIINTNSITQSSNQNNSLTRFIKSHFFYLRSLPDSREIREGNLACFDLYRPDETVPNMLRYMNSSGRLNGWMPQVTPPSLDDEFFLYLASWGYFEVNSRLCGSCTNSTIANEYVNMTLKEYLIGGKQAASATRDFTAFEHVCLLSLCNASHCNDFGSSSTTPGFLFFKELFVHFIAARFDFNEYPQILSDRIDFSTSSPIHFQSSLQQFEIPYLGPSGTTWSLETYHYLQEVMTVGNIKYRPNPDRIDITFDLIFRGNMLLDGGAIEAKFRDDAVSYADMKTYLTGLVSKNCRLVMIACATPPQNITVEYRSLAEYLSAKSINAYVVKHVKLPGQIPPGSLREDSVHAKQIEISAVGTPIVNPERVLIVFESHLRLPKI